MPETAEEQDPGKFDDYARRLGKVSAACSGFLLLIGALPCGSIGVALFALLQFPALLVLLWIPLLWRRIRGRMLHRESAKWALIASGSFFAVLLLAFLFDRGGSGCLR